MQLSKIEARRMQAKKDRQRWVKMVVHIKENARLYASGLQLLPPPRGGFIGYFVPGSKRRRLAGIRDYAQTRRGF